MASSVPAPTRSTLATAYSGRDNAFNCIRLIFALAVLVGHAEVLGYGKHSIPVDLGGLAVSGFFVLSGFLITRSARRTGFVRYWWHRGLRIFPAYWVCLLVTAGIVGPLLWYHRHGTLRGYRGLESGPLSYFYRNFTTDQRQGSIGDILAGLPNGAINGSLWTLKYELLCYILVSVLALVAVLRRAKWIVALLALGGVGLIVYDFAHSAVMYGPLPGPLAREVFRLPGAGYFLTWYFVILMTAFLLGAVAELYKEHIPVNTVLGVLSLLVVVVAIYQGWPILGPALLAYVYALLWLGIRLPGVFRRIGRRNDYSYGVYIYAFIVQQSLAVYGVPRHGLAVYLIASIVLTMVLAALSWHLVEKPMLGLKDWSPSSLWNRGGTPPVPVQPSPSPSPSPSPVPSPSPSPEAAAPSGAPSAAPEEPPAATPRPLSTTG